MTMITAIKSFFTPVKVLNNENVTVIKKLQRDGSTIIKSFDREGLPIKTILKEPFDNLTYRPVLGNTLSVGHRTKVINHKEGTNTNILKYKYTVEKPIRDLKDRKNIILNGGESLFTFRKSTQKDKIFQGCSVLITKYPRFSQMFKTIYDKSGKIISTVKKESHNVHK